MEEMICKLKEPNMGKVWGNCLEPRAVRLRARRHSALAELMDSGLHHRAGGPTEETIDLQSYMPPSPVTPSPCR